MKKVLMIVVVVSMLFVGCNQNKDNVKTNESESNDVGSEVEETTTENNPVAGVEMSGIETEDYKGNSITDDTFKGKKLTVLNLWATWCGPCVEEMPDFEKVAVFYKDKEVQVIGLTIDSDEDEVKILKEKLGITYPLIKENEQLKTLITSHFDYVPVTLFIDSDGKIIESFIPGGTTEEQLTQKIEALIND